MFRIFFSSSSNVEPQKRRKQIILLFIGCVLIAQYLHAGPPKFEPMYNPPPIPICAALPAKTPKELIQSSISRSGWVWTEASGALNATYISSGRNASVVVAYAEGDSVQISYSSSIQLGHRDVGGKSYIHWQYNEWVKRLESAITDSFSKYCG